MFYYIKFRKIKIKHIISRLSFNFFHLDYTHFKTSIHTGFLSWKNMRQNDDVMMRITQNCTRTTQITMVTIYAHSKRNRQTSNIIHVLVDRNIYYAKKKTPTNNRYLYLLNKSMFFNIHEEQHFKFKFVKPFLVKSFPYTKKEHQAILFQSQLSKQTNKKLGKTPCILQPKYL